MSGSYTVSNTTTFTLTHAKYLASKVRTDLMRMHRYYGKPSLNEIDEYEEEVTAFLKEGYLGEVWYGFRRDEKWIEPSLKYTARDLSGDGADDRPGLLPTRKDIEGASFYSYLTYSSRWNALSETEKEAFRSKLAVKRVGAPKPEISGYLSSDQTYSAGGRALNRSVVKGY
ncbi:hypothetical protein [Maricaulis sp.]|uniref:HORMA-1 domain-containing protein n=1 Tax=Maricaulis sp. TaxID=1486257 RepID=UPI00262344F2|nr:hypothetical protein [Maricaulis sp.]